MSLTWGNIFDFAYQMFEFNQNEIADRLKVSPSTITRAKERGGELNRIKSEEIYEKLFTLKKGRDEKTALRELKEIVEGAGFQENIQDLKTDSYRVFVMGLVRLVKGNKLSKSSNKKEVPVSVVTKTENNLPCEQMRVIFNRELLSLNVEGFIETDPLNAMDAYLFDDVNQFYKIIKHHVRQRKCPDKGEIDYCRIIKFTAALSRYVKYLRNKMSVARAFENGDCGIKSYREWRKPPIDDSGEFKNKTHDYQNRLRLLLKELHGTP